METSALTQLNSKTRLFYGLVKRRWSGREDSNIRPYGPELSEVLFPTLLPSVTTALHAATDAPSTCFSAHCILLPIATETMLPLTESTHKSPHSN